MVPPAELVALLRSGAVDVALLPIVELFDDPSLIPLPGMAIGSDGAVRTVKLLSPVKITAVQNIQLDRESRTSNLLVQMLLAEIYGLDANRIKYVLPQTVDRTLPRIVIGDKAIADEAAITLDLGALWKELTGQPFVYACWMTRDTQNVAELTYQLKNCLEKNLRRIPEICETLAPHFARWPQSQMIEYLSTNIRYRMGAREIEGIRRFHELLVRHGFMDKPFAWREVHDSAA